MQEIGRAGRDGEPSHCEIFACADDAVILENFTYGDTPTSDSVYMLIDEILGQGDFFDVSEYDLSQRYDVRPLVIKTLLTYLELEGIIRSTGSFFTEYKFQPLRPSSEILAKYDATHADFLRRLFRCAKKAKIWFKIDTTLAAAQMSEPRDRIIAALNYLETTGDLILEATGARQTFRRLTLPTDLPGLREKLAARFQQREDHDIIRVRKVLEYAGHPGCLTQFLLAYFGEQRGDCGHCSRCAGEIAQPLNPVNSIDLGREQFLQLESLRSEGNNALLLPRQVARFLCGIASPASTRAKLRQHAMFGAFDTTPFHEVLQFVEDNW